MGLNITVITEPGVDGYPKGLSRGFCYFLCGLDAHSNHELGQLENVLDCDLSIIKQMDIYHFSKKYEESKLETDDEELVDKESIKEQFRKGRIDAFQDIDAFMDTLEEFLTKLEHAENYYDQLEYNEDWICGYLKNGELVSDVKVLLKFAASAKDQGAKQITFDMD